MLTLACWKVGCVELSQVLVMPGEAGLDQLAASPLQNFDRAQPRSAELIPEQPNLMNIGAA